MMTRIEALEILGLKATASLEEVKAAYSELSKNCHPEEEPEKFEELHEAFSYLYRSGRRDARRKAVIQNSKSVNTAIDSNRDEQVERESDSAEIKDQEVQLRQYRTINDTGLSGFSLEEMIETLEEGGENTHSETKNNSAQDDQDKVILRLKEDIGDKLDLRSDRRLFQERIRQEDEFNEEKQREDLAEEAIKHARILYRKALNDPIRNSYTCMNELFRVYDKDVYQSKRFLNELATILSDKRLDNSIHKKVAEFYGFIGIGSFVKNVPFEQREVFETVKRRWTPAKDNSLFMTALGFFMLFELAFIIIRSTQNKVISVILLAILVFGFIINEDYSSKHKRGYRREFITVIMSVLALVIFFIGKALGSFDGIKMGDSQKSAWGTAIVLILGGCLVGSLYMYYRNVRSRNLV